MMELPAKGGPFILCFIRAYPIKCEAYFTGACSMLFLILKSAKICEICGCAMLFALFAMLSAPCPMRPALNVLFNHHRHKHRICLCIPLPHPPWLLVYPVTPFQTAFLHPYQCTLCPAGNNIKATIILSIICQECRRDPTSLDKIKMRGLSSHWSERIWDCIGYLSFWRG